MTMRHTIAATAITASLFATTASAEPLADIEKGFVALFTATMVIASKCPNITVVPGGALGWADQVGVDGIKFSESIGNALQSAAHRDYDRTKLIPEATRILIATMNEVGAAIDKNKAKTCREWSTVLVNGGFIEIGKKEMQQ